MNSIIWETRLVSRKGENLNTNIVTITALLRLLPDVRRNWKGFHPHELPLPPVRLLTMQVDVTLVHVRHRIAHHGRGAYYGLL